MPSSTQPPPSDDLPVSVQAEQAVLGALLLSGQAYDTVADRISEEDFTARHHQILFRAISELAARGHPFDAVTLGDWLENKGLTEEAGGTAYVIELANNTPSAANVGAYADMVREASLRRRLATIALDVFRSARDQRQVPVSELLGQAEGALFALAEKSERARDGMRPMRELARETVREIQDRYERGGEMPGVRTGFVDLDAALGALQAADYVVLAARPSMGKTSLCLSIAAQAALRAGLSVGIFSMEMSAAQLVLRLLSSLSGVDSQALRSGDLADEEWPRITEAIATLSASRLFIDDSPALSPGDLRSRARRLKREHGLDLVMVDYLQLMQVPGTRENRTNEISTISRAMKALAKELDVPVVVLSQLNRALEQRSNKRPMLSDLRESGGIEQDADVVLFIYRDDYYHADCPNPGVTEIIIGKQRNGPTATVLLAFDGARTRFSNHAPDAGEAPGQTVPATP